MGVLLWLVALIAAACLWVAVSTRVLRVRRRADQIHFATTTDGWSIALHRYLAEKPAYAEPVVLCHGLGANRFNFDLAEDRSLVRALTAVGFEVWSLELRGHGCSDKPGWFSPHGWGFTFDDHLDRDLPAALEVIRLVTAQPRVFWIGHSMGGMLGYALAGDPDRDDLAGLVAVAAPVWLDRSFGVGRLRLLARLASPFQAVWFRPLARFFAPLLGRAPGALSQPFLLPGSMEPRLVRRAMANLVENDSSALVRQLMSWVGDRAFCSVDRERNFLQRLGDASAPVLLIAAEQDGLASPDSVAPAYERIRSKDKQLRIFGTDAGDDFDFGHGDLLLGRLAPMAIYVEILDWLEQRATALSGITEVTDAPSAPAETD